MTVHRDDFTISAPAEDLTLLHTELAKVWSVKQQILGPGEGMQRQVRILNRFLTWTENAREYEADQRLADIIIIKQVGSTASKRVGTPAVNDNAQQLKAGSSEAAPPREDTAAYWVLSARLNYLAQDRADLQFSARSAAKRIRNPRPPKAVGLGATQESGAIPCGKTTNGADCSLGKISQVLLMDSATVIGQEDREDRKSTSGGVLHIGLHT